MIQIANSHLGSLLREMFDEEDTSPTPLSDSVKEERAKKRTQNDLDLIINKDPYLLYRHLNRSVYLNSLHKEIGLPLLNDPKSKKIKKNKKSKNNFIPEGLGQYLYVAIDISEYTDNDVCKFHESAKGMVSFLEKYIPSESITHLTPTEMDLLSELRLYEIEDFPFDQTALTLKRLSFEKGAEIPIYEYQKGKFDCLKKKGLVSLDARSNINVRKDLFYCALLEK